MEELLEHLGRFILDMFSPSGDIRRVVGFFLLTTSAIALLGVLIALVCGVKLGVAGLILFGVFECVALIAALKLLRT